MLRGGHGAMQKFCCNALGQCLDCEVFAGKIPQETIALAATISLVLEVLTHVESQKFVKNATLEPASLVWQRSKVAMYRIGV